MLITSRTAKGNCPVCGAANCSCGGPTTVFPVDQRITAATPGGGKMVRIQIRPGVLVNVREETARELGLLPKEPEPKMQQPVRNKKRQPAGNKSREGA